jgi:hypothetical protein
MSRLRLPTMLSLGGRFHELPPIVTPPAPVRDNPRRAGGARRNPDPIAIWGLYPSDIGVSVSTAEPGYLGHALFRVLVQNLGRLQEVHGMKLARPDKTTDATAGFAMACLRARKLVATSGLGSAIEWPSEAERARCERMIQDTLRSASHLLYGHKVDNAAMKVALQYALGESFSMRASDLEATGELFYLEHLRTQLPWTSEADEEFLETVGVLYQVEDRTIPDRAAFHFARRRGEELFEANGYAHTDPFDTIPAAQLQEEFLEYLNEDMREYRKRDSNEREQVRGIKTFWDAVGYAPPFIYDPEIVYSTRPFLV